MKLWILAVNSGPWTSLTRIPAKIFSSGLLLHLWIGNLGRPEEYHQNRRDNITKPASSSTCTWLHSSKFTFEVCNNVDIRLILKASFGPSPCHTEDVLIVNVTVLLPVFATSLATSCCYIMWYHIHSILMSLYVWKILCSLTVYSPESLTYIPSILEASFNSCDV